MTKQEIHSNHQFLRQTASYDLPVDETPKKNITTDGNGSSISYTYDKALGLVSNVHNPLGVTTSYQYYNSNLLKNMNVSKNLESSEMEYGYNAKQQLEWMKTPNGEYYKLTYSKLGDPLTVSVGSTSNPTCELMNIGYVEDREGTTPVYTDKVASKKYGPAGDQYLFSYDEYDRIKEIRLKKKGYSWESLLYSYQYDSLGRVEKIEDRCSTDAPKITYQYDDKDRLAKEFSNEFPSYEVQYEYNSHNENNVMKFKNPGKRIVQSYDSLSTSRKATPQTFFEDVKNQTGPTIKYSCFFHEVKKVGTAFEYQKSATARTPQLTYVMEPVDASGTVTKNVWIPCLELKENAWKFTYALTTTNAVRQTIMYCVKNSDVKFELIFEKCYLEDYKKGNPYNTIILININSYGYYGNSEWTIDYKDLIDFSSKLNEMYMDLKGDLQFKDKNLGSYLFIKCDTTGKFIFSGKLINHMFQKLEFQFTLDQTYLKSFVEKIYKDFVLTDIYTLVNS